MNALNLSRLNTLSPYMVIPYFLRWFSGAKQSQQFFIKTDVIVDEGMENFIAIIVPRQHPYLEEIVSRYNAEIEMFKSSK